MSVTVVQYSSCFFLYTCSSSEVSSLNSELNMMKGKEDAGEGKMKITVHISCFILQ